MSTIHQPSRLEHLLDNPPAETKAIADLWNWSANCQYPSPASMFLDLVGVSEEQWGERLCTYKWPALGYLELAYLADALNAWANRPRECERYIMAVLDAECDSD
jgi:hypothetical protein